MKKLFSAMLFAALFAVSASAQEEAKRFLLIVETSKSTKVELPAIRQCVSNLFATGFSGQMQLGDTLGVWTYSDELRAGNFPMQVCGAEDAHAVLKRLDEFLKKQRYENDARFAQVLPQLAAVVDNSEALNILIVSDGFEPMVGTPFDAAINKVYTAHRDELQAAHVPFVTVLQARDGKVAHCTINSAAGAISIPPLPSLPKPKPVDTTPPSEAVVVKTNASLIVDYTKSNSVAAVTPPQPEVKKENTPPPTNSISPPPNLIVTAASLKTAASNAATAVEAKSATEKKSDTAVLVLGGILILLLGMLAGWFFMRGRAPQQSAITQSIERGKK